MKKTVYLNIFCVAVFLMLSGCTAEQEHVEKSSPSNTIPAASTEEATETVEAPAVDGSVDMIGIWAYIQEIHDDTMRIRPDTEDLPGDLTVTGIQDLPDSDGLQEGMKIQILMQDLGGDYRAEEVILLSEDEETVQENLLLTEAPVFTLTDIASSVDDVFEIMPADYEWNAEKNGQVESVIACGSGPLDAAEMGVVEKLKVREPASLYHFSTKVAPDILKIRQWDASAISQTDVMEEHVTAYYYKMPLLELQAGKVYEFSAEWKEENFAQNKFYGTAAYFLKTE